MYNNFITKTLPQVVMNEFLFDMSLYEKPKEQIPLSGKKRIRYAVRNQVQFTINSLDELIPQEHRVRDVWEYVCQLDISTFYDQIKVLEDCKGPPTADPRILLSLWLYAMLEGIVSARRIARLCNEHHAYIWLCGGVSINYHSLSDFRIKNPEGFRTLLQESIALMWKSGVFHPDEVAQDGTRVKANAGFSSYRTEKTLNEYLIEANNRIRALEEENLQNPSALSLREKSARKRAANEREERITKAREELKVYKEERILSSKKNHNNLKEEDVEKLRSSVTDSECRKMKMGDGGFRLAYNIQFATSVDKKIILGVDVVNTLDPGTLVPMMQQVEKTLKQVGCSMPTKWLVDSAYANNNDMQNAENHFPNTTIYSAPTSSQKGVDPLEPRKKDKPAMVKLRERMKFDDAKKTYSKRGHTAEFANAVAKARGMGEFLVRGITKVTNMALLCAVVHNMMIFFRT